MAKSEFDFRVTASFLYILLRLGIPGLAGFTNEPRWVHVILAPNSMSLK